MDIGTGIFMAGIAIALVWLYMGTRDRWRWGRITAWLVGGLVGLWLLVAVGLYLYRQLNDPYAPMKKTELVGVTLGQSEGDVLFLKGKPDQTDEDTWAYSNDTYTLLVFFGDGKVETVLMHPKPSTSDGLFGIYWGTTVSDLVEDVGEPATFKTSPDGAERLYEYPQFNAFFILKAGKVQSFGIYEPNKGGLEFNPEVPAS